jgi:hypothetical protein
VPKSVGQCFCVAVGPSPYPHSYGDGAAASVVCIHAFCETIGGVRKSCRWQLCGGDGHSVHAFDVVSYPATNAYQKAWGNIFVL